MKNKLINFIVMGLLVGGIGGYLLYSLLLPIMGINEVIDGDFLSSIFVNYPIIVVMLSALVGAFIGYLIGRSSNLSQK